MPRGIHGHQHAGESHYNSKLRLKDIRMIQLLAKDGYTYRVIGMLFKISSAHACRVASRKCWLRYQHE